MKLPALKQLRKNVFQVLKRCLEQRGELPSFQGGAVARARCL